jgi:hypothetical protein
MTSFGLSACMHLLMGLVLALILIETEQDEPHRIMATSVSELDNQNQELEFTSSLPELDNQEQTENVPDVQLPVVAMSQETSTLHVESALQQQDTNSPDAMEALVMKLTKTKSNAEFLLGIRPN